MTTILIVDVDADTREQIAMSLQEHQFQTIEAADGDAPNSLAPTPFSST